MIYPNNFEHKIGFDDIRQLLKGYCLSTLGKEKVDGLSFSDDYATVSEQLQQVREFRRLQQEADDFPMQYFFDVRQAVARIRLEGTHLEEEEVWDLRRSLETIGNMVKYLSRSEERETRSEERETRSEERGERNEALGSAALLSKERGRRNERSPSQ